MQTLIRGGDAYTPDGLTHDAAVLVEDGNIAFVGPRTQVPPIASVDSEIDARGGVVAAGFIDLQINGAGGRFLTEEPTVDAVLVMARTVARYGCTAFLPTVITSAFETMLSAVRAVHEASEQVTDGACVLGVHLEGPFINPEAAGAHDAAYIRLPSVDDLNALWEASGGGIKLLTLAPEMPGALDLLGAAKRYGIAVAVGHTRADYPQMMEAVDAGASLATHLFNAMGGLTARDPGATGAVLASSEFKASLIADGYHVHPAMMDLAVRTKGVDGLVLVTDAMPPMGTDLTEFTLYGQPITVRDSACFMADGTLAGSMLTMDRAVRNMRDLVDVSVQDALMMASANPAEVIGESKHRGTLEVGKAADIVVMDSSLHVTATIVDGKVVYQAGSA